MIPGFATAPDAITPAEEAALIAAIDSADLTPFRFQGWEGKRLTTSFGWLYDFDTGAFAPADPIPDWLLPIRTRAAALGRLEPDSLVQALLTRYDPGATIGWHRDRPQFETIVGLSLGAPATLRLRRRTGTGRTGFARASTPLEARALYCLSGEVRHDWEHSIAALAATRWSIAFRSLSEKGRALAH